MTPWDILGRIVLTIALIVLTWNAHAGGHDPSWALPILWLLVLVMWVTLSEKAE